MILSIDGGGIRGILPAYVLNELEEELKKRINEQSKKKDPENVAIPEPDVRLGECFDLIAGTSTGGIIALAMRRIDPQTNRPRLTMKHILDLYKNEGSIIFPKKRYLAGLIFPKYNPQPLESILEKYFESTKLSDLLHSTVITGYDMDKEGLHLFNSSEASQGTTYDFYIKDVARATSAAPTYFPAAIIQNLNSDKYRFIDGGVEANNPTFHAYVEDKRRFPKSKRHIISLGTGEARLFTSDTKDIGGKLPWIYKSHIVNLFMKSSSKNIERLIPQIGIFSLQEDNYTRLQFELDKQIAGLDNATSKNIEYLMGYAKDKIGSMEAGKNNEWMIIKNALMRVYAQHEHYIYHNLVTKVRKQADTGKVNLSRCHLIDRAMWEISTSLRPNSITVLDLSGNDLSKTRYAVTGLHHLK